MADKQCKLSHKAGPHPFIEEFSGPKIRRIPFSRAEHIIIAEKEGFWITIRDVVHSKDPQVWYLIQFQINKILIDILSKNRFNSRYLQRVANLPIKPISCRLTEKHSNQNEELMDTHLKRGRE